MATASQVSDAFGGYAANLEAEAAKLKAISNIKGVAEDGLNTDVVNQLQAIERMMMGLEKDFIEFEDYLDGELEALNEVDSINKQCKVSLTVFQELVESVPSRMLPKAGDMPSEDEFKEVPKLTRNRLTKGAVDKALLELRALVAEKQKEFAIPRKKMNHVQRCNIDEYTALKVADHEGMIFLRELELRSTTIFESGESTGRAIIATLKAMKSKYVRIVRSGGETTYVVL